MFVMTRLVCVLISTSPFHEPASLAAVVEAVLTADKF